MRVQNDFSQTLLELAENDWLQAWGDGLLSESLGARQISLSTVRRRLKRIYQDVPKSQDGEAINRPCTHRFPWGVFHGMAILRWIWCIIADRNRKDVYSLQMVDVATGWTCQPQCWAGADVMVDAFCRCELRIPFPIIEIHPDNGSEFFTHALLEHWGDVGVEMLSRSHPYRKNDNRFVEHRNGDMIRAWLGHWRYDTAAQTRALNKFYDLIWLYHNFCQPVMRQISKETLEWARFADAS